MVDAKQALVCPVLGILRIPRAAVAAAGGARPVASQAPAPPAPPPILSLTRAVATALRQHPSLTRLAEARERVAASALYPHLTFEALEKDGPPSAPGFGLSGLANSTLTRHTGAS